MSSNIPELPRAAPAPAARASSGVIWLVVGLLSSVVAALLVTLIGTVIFPQFSSAFATFGTELPSLTRLATRFFLAWWLAPVFFVLARLFWPRRKQRPLIAGLVGLLSLVGVPLMLLSAYLPILSLSSGL